MTLISKQGRPSLRKNTGTEKEMDVVSFVDYDENGNPVEFVNSTNINAGKCIFVEFTKMFY